MLTSEKELFIFKHIFQHSLGLVMTLDNTDGDELLENLDNSQGIKQQLVSFQSQKQNMQ